MGTPNRAVKNPVVVGEPPLPTEPRDPQEAGHRALAGRADGADQQQLGVVPRPLLQEHRREGQDDRDEAGWQAHGGVPRPGRASLLSARFVASPARPAPQRPSALRTAKVELRAFSDWGSGFKPLLVPAAPVGHSLLSAVGARAAASRGPEGGRPNLCRDLRSGWPPLGSKLSAGSPRPSSPRERRGSAPPRREPD